MKSLSKPVLTLGAAAVAVTVLALPANAGPERLVHISVADVSRPPVGWIEFCADNPRDCAGRPTMPRDVVLSTPAWKELVRINLWVNSHDQADDRPRTLRRGREMVLPRGRLRRLRGLRAAQAPHADRSRAGRARRCSITVVRDRQGDGHAVLTVKTDKGEFILDNQNDEILLWSDTGYRFVKRQSQADPNVWISLGDPRAAPATATSR